MPDTPMHEPTEPDIVDRLEGVRCEGVEDLCREAALVIRALRDLLAEREASDA